MNNFELFCRKLIVKYIAKYIVTEGQTNPYDRDEKQLQLFKKELYK